MESKGTCDASASWKTWAKLRPRKKLQVCSNLVDRISQLPDGILIDILSFLSVKEAGRSCVLSHRWRYLWKMTNRLNFVAQSVSSSELDLERSRYVKWVNEVLKSHECPALEEFRVKFDLDITVCSQDVDNWIKFFIPRRVKVLEINLGLHRSSEAYTISKECCKYFRSPSNLNSIKCLKEISLHHINLNGELLDYILTECLHLETLTMGSSKDAIDLKVTSPSLHSLCIFKCNFTTIELCAPKLVKFMYLGAMTEFRIGTNPCLANLILGGGDLEETIGALVSFLDLPKLKMLQLSFFLKNGVEMPRIPQLRILKYLTLIIKVTGDTSLLGFADIVAAAPYLKKVTLKLLSSAPSHYSRSMRSLVRQPHECLEVVELHGFLGCQSEVEFAAYLLKNAINLKRLVIDPYPP